MIDIATARQGLDAASDQLAAVSYHVHLVCRYCPHGCECDEWKNTTPRLLAALRALGRVRVALGWVYAGGRWG